MTKARSGSLGLDNVSLSDTFNHVLQIQLDSPIPLADQLVTGLRGAIARRELAPGDPLPTVRQLAADLGINLNTVSRAYRVLEAAGLVRTARGRGTVVTSNTETDAASQPKPELSSRMAAVLADARLAGLGRGDVELLLHQQMAPLWPET